LEAPSYDHFQDGDGPDDGMGGGSAVTLVDNVIPSGKTAVLTQSPLRRGKNGSNGGGPAKN
jgi:hypothetical protein